MKTTPVRITWRAPGGGFADVAQGVAQLGLASIPGIVSRQVDGAIEIECNWPSNMSIAVPDTSAEVAIEPAGWKVPTSPALVVRLPRIKALLLAVAARPTGVIHGDTSALEWTLARPVTVALAGHVLTVTAL